MHALNLGSLATVQRYVKQLEVEGRLTRTSLGNIEPLPQLSKGETALVPLIGEIACGEPCFEVENIEESFALPRSVFGDGELFMLRAFGESMIEVGINKGDLLVIKRQNYAQDGEIVVALVNGKNTLKRFYRKHGQIILHPENKTMQDIVVKNCEIQGVLVSCIKMY
jgi:repressor LexA